MMLAVWIGLGVLVGVIVVVIGVALFLGAAIDRADEERS